MFVFVGGRRSGKTTTIASWYLERPYQRDIIVGDISRQRQMLNAIGKMCNYMLDPDRVRRNIHPVQHIIGSRLFGGMIGECAVDDAEYVLERLISAGSGARVDLATMNATLIHNVTVTDKPGDYIDGEVVEDWEDVIRARKLREQQIKELAAKPFTLDLTDFNRKILGQEVKAIEAPVDPLS